MIQSLLRQKAIEIQEGELMWNIVLAVFAGLGVIGAFYSILGLIRRERAMRNLHRQVAEAGRKKT